MNSNDLKALMLNTKLIEEIDILLLDSRKMFNKPLSVALTMEVYNTTLSDAIKSRDAEELRLAIFSLKDYLS